MTLAQALLATAQAATGEERATIEDDLEERCAGFAAPKIAAGLVKLLVDRLEFEEPSEEAPALRKAAFDAGAKALRALADDATPAAFEEKAAALAPLPLAALRAKLYADLPAARRMLGWDELEARELLDRWNLAQVQGLVMRANRLEIKAIAPELKRVRRVLRWLKFCRLVAEVVPSGADWSIVVEGPAKILAMQKKYGLQLAQFVAAVPLLGKWQLSADIAFPHGRPARLVLDETAPLASPHERALGWIPEEIDVVAKKLAEADGPWKLDLTPTPRTVGTGGLCVPDFTFKRRDGGATVFVEFFHRWHRHQLTRRLDDLRARPDPQLVLAVEDALLSDEELRATIEAHPQALVFKGFPSERKLRAMLATHE